MDKAILKDHSSRPSTCNKALIMRQDIETRLRTCYPTGLFEFFEESQANYEPAKAFWKGLPPLLEAHGFVCDGPEIWSEAERVVEFSIRRKGDPDSWFFNTDKAKKIEQLRLSGQPFVTIQADVSTVIPAMYLRITEIWFDPDTYGENAKGQHDDGLKHVFWLRQTEFEPWAPLIDALRTYAASLGLEDLDKATLEEDVPFITSPIFNDDNDDGWNDSDEWPNLPYLRSLPQYTCNVFNCLFDINV
jgi:hypothetical protein